MSANLCLALIKTSTPLPHSKIQAIRENAVMILLLNSCVDPTRNMVHLPTHPVRPKQK